MSRRTLHDRFFERAAAPRVDVFLGEPALGGGDLGNRLLQRALLRPAAVQDAGLVEMDMGLDKPAITRRPSSILSGASAAICGSIAAMRPSAIPISAGTVPAGDARVAQHEIERHRHPTGQPRHDRDKQLRAPDPAPAQMPRRAHDAPDSRT